MSSPSETAATEVTRAYDRVRAWVVSLGVELDPSDPPPGTEGAPAALPPFARDAPEPARDELRRHARIVAPSPVPGHVAPPEERRAALIRLGGDEIAAVLDPADAGTDDASAHRALDEVEALVALDRGAAILDDFRGHGERRVVLEIDGGAGSFARRFSTLCPDVTYVMASRPETFLFSAPELIAAFPGARVHLWEAGTVPREARFVFVPVDRLGELRAERLDLTLNLGSFGSMAAPELEAHLERAHRLRSRYLYGLGPHRAAVGAAPDAVRRAIERWYWLQEAPVLPASYRTLLRENPNAKFKGGRASASIHRAFAREHLVGWRRLRP